MLIQINKTIACYHFIIIYKTEPGNNAIAKLAFLHTYKLQVLKNLNIQYNRLMLKEFLFMYLTCQVRYLPLKIKLLKENNFSKDKIIFL